MDAQSVFFGCGGCQRKYKWKHELAGKRVKCKCGHKLHVPASPPAPAQREPVAAPAAEAEPFNPLADMLGDLDAKANDPAIARCPHCGNQVASTAALCVQCGTMLQADSKGKRKKKRTKIKAAPRAAGQASSFAGGADPTMKIAGAGLLIHGGGFIAIFVGMAIGLITWAQSGEVDGFLVTEGARMVAIAGMVGLMVGPLLCVAAPNDAGRGYLIAALACLIGTAVLFGTSTEFKHPVIAVILSSILTLFATAAMLKFISTFAGYASHAALEASADSMLNLYKYMLAGNLVAVGLLIFPLLRLIAEFILGIMFLVLFVRYIIVCTALGLAVVRQ